MFISNHLTVHVPILAFAIMIGFGGWRHSPTADEPAHLVSGWSHWKLGRFDLYRVNPPLVRLVASIPLGLNRANFRLDTYIPITGGRPEFRAGSAFLDDYKSRSLMMLSQARWMCLPFAVLGGLICYRWSTDLYGYRAGLLALTLWCFSPTVIAHGQLITPDLAAASMGVAAAYTYWRWLNTSCWSSALVAGVMLGLAQLTKFTLIVLIPLWPVLWIIYRKRMDGNWGGQLSQLSQLSVLLLIAMYMINAGYGFEGSFTRVKDYQFVSSILSGQIALRDDQTGNRFADDWLGNFPIPLPRNYVLGIDAQRQDFEAGKWSYMHGKWRWGGWWHYYVYAMFLKEPLAIWGLAGIAIFWTRRNPAPRRDESVVLLPLVAILLLVSSERGFSHHPRYLLPIYPFFFVWFSRVAACSRKDEQTCAQPMGQRRTTRCLVILSLMAWYVTSSLSVYPHSLSYFNELAGGPMGGPRFLLASSTDWGQNLIYLREWVDDHPEIDELRLAWPEELVSLVNPKLVGIDILKPPEHAAWKNSHEPMWCLISVNELYANHGKYNHFRKLKPTEVIAYSIYAYRLEQRK